MKNLLLSLLAIIFFTLATQAQTKETESNKSLMIQINSIVETNRNVIADKEKLKELEEKLKNEINTYEENHTESEDTIKVLLENTNDSLILELDTVKYPPQIVEEKIVFIDTVQLQERFTEMKSKHFGKQYSEKEWQKKNNLMSKKAFEGNYELDDNKEVFGWHPFWVGNAYESYNFSLLSTISYFSYEVEPSTGNYTDIHDWKTTALIDSAHKYQTNVLLTVTNFGYKNNATFLENNNDQFINLTSQLITLIKERDASGVNIDFENIPYASKNQLTNFLIGLSNDLAKENYTLVVTLPPKDFDNVFEIEKLKSYVDYFVIMGYEFYGQNSQVAGPMAPINSGDIWWEFNIERCIQEYIVDGLNPEQTVLACPLYGGDWVTEDLKFPSNAKYFDQYLTLKQVYDKLGNVSPKRDELSGSAYHVYTDYNGDYHQLWFDDSVTLQRKVDLINHYELKGIGFWALGYDNGLSDTWKVISKNFTKPEHQLASIKWFSVAQLKRIIQNIKRLITNPKSFLKNARSIVVLFSSLLGINLMLALSFIKWKHRLSKLLRLVGITTITIFFFILLTVFLLINHLITVREMLLIIGGILSGGSVFYFLSYKLFFNRELP